MKYQVFALVISISAQTMCMHGGRLLEGVSKRGAAQDLCALQRRSSGKPLSAELLGLRDCESDNELVEVVYGQPTVQEDMASVTGETNEAGTSQLERGKTLNELRGDPVENKAVANTLYGTLGTLAGCVLVYGSSWVVWGCLHIQQNVGGFSDKELWQ